ncbi:MAG: hypothetical protein EBZ77_01845 [Chitinophagia bacterium]|nr:hypothetical protein [Chitinophagia bacterium]
MPSITIRPAMVGKFATVLEGVATAQGVSTAAVIRELMVSAWGPNLENAPVATIPPVDQVSPVSPVVKPDKPDSQTRQSNPTNPVSPLTNPDALFGFSA